VIAHLQIPWIRPQGTIRTAASCDAWPAGERFVSQQKRPGRPPSLVDRLCHEREGRHANDNAGWENVDTQNVDTSGLEGRLMLFMVIERFKNRDAKGVYRRFRDGGRGAPTGLTYVHTGLKPISTVVSRSWSATTHAFCSSGSHSGVT